MVDSIAGPVTRPLSAWARFPLVEEDCADVDVVVGRAAETVADADACCRCATSPELTGVAAGAAAAGAAFGYSTTYCSRYKFTHETQADFSKLSLF